jgi:hypothetical protein
MKVASNHDMERITPEEAKDVESLREINEGNAKSVHHLIKELKAD